MFSESEKVAETRARVKKFTECTFEKLGYRISPEEFRNTDPEYRFYTFVWLLPPKRIRVSLLFNPGDGSQEPPSVMPHVDSFSIFLTQGNPKNLFWPEDDPNNPHHKPRMSLTDYCEDKKLPLGSLDKNYPIRPFPEFANNFFAELTHAAETYLKPFLLKEKFEYTRDPRDDY